MKTQIQSVWQEIQDTAPAGLPTATPFYDWILALGARVKAGEVEVVDALQAVRWLMIERMQEREAAIVERMSGLGPAYWQREAAPLAESSAEPMIGGAALSSERVRG